MMYIQKICVKLLPTQAVSAMLTCS